jgi:DNA polymerase III sliding clamp (beta) subunit (PCNA family)
VVDSYAASEDGTLTVHAVDGQLKIRGSSGGCCLEVVVEGEVDDELTKPVSVSRKAMAAVVLRGSSAKVAKKKEYLTLSSGRSRYRLPVQATVKHGRFPDLGESKATVINAAILKSALQSTHFGHDETGTKDVRISVRKGLLTVDTSDSFRAAVYQERVPEIDSEFEASLQHDPLLKVVSAFDLADVWIRATDRSCSISDATTTIWLPVLSAQRYRTLDQLAKARAAYRTSAKTTVGTSDIREAIRDAIAVLASKSRVPVEFETRGEFLHITTHGELGTHEARLSVQKAGGAVSFITSPSYIKVMAALAAKAGDHCEIEVLGDRVVVVSVRSREARAIYLFSQKQRSVE